VDGGAPLVRLLSHMVPWFRLARRAVHRVERHAVDQGHQPSRPPPAKIRPGRPAPTTGPETVTPLRSKAALKVPWPMMSVPTRIGLIGERGEFGQPGRSYGTTPQIQGSQGFRDPVCSSIVLVTPS